MGEYILILSLIAIIFIGLFAYYCELFLREYRKANNHHRAAQIIICDALTHISHNIADIATTIASERGERDSSERRTKNMG